jgi:hypothetical protein
MLIHKHLIVTGHYDKEIDYTRLYDLNHVLIKELDMKILSGPYVTQCNDKDNEGFTMMTAITTSYFQLDIYSCKKYDKDTVLKILENHNFYSKKEQIIDRPFVKKDS